MPSSAPNLLRQAAELIDQRAASRDRPAERSMRAAVEAFNVLTGLSLTELQGWTFMAVLKIARAQGGTLNPDDYLDGAAYLALALECVSGTSKGPPEATTNEGVPKPPRNYADALGPVRARITQEWLNRADA